MHQEELAKEIREAKSKRERLFGELRNLEAREHTGEADDGLQERIGRVNTGIANADETLRELEAEYGRQAQQEDRIREAAKNREHREAGAAFHEPTPTRTPAESRQVEARDGGLRTIERYSKSGELRSEAAGSRSRSRTESCATRWIPNSHDTYSRLPRGRSVRGGSSSSRSEAGW